MKRKVLIIDDLKSWQGFYQEILATEFDILTTGYFDEAANCLNNSTFDLIILDIRLDLSNNANVDGIKLLKIIKEKNPNTPVVIVSGYPDAIKQINKLDIKPERIFVKSRFNYHDFLSEIKKLIID